MMRAIRWLWLVLPRGWVLFVFFLVYAFLEANWLYSPDRELLAVRNTVVGIGCFAYGLFRAIAFHPLNSDEYRKWLAVSPWTVGKRLPAGPVHLVVQDLLVMGVLLSLLHPWDMKVLAYLSVFLFPYQLVLCLTLWPTGQRWTCYALLLALGLPIRLLEHPTVATGVLVLLYPFTYWASRRCLGAFPWDVPEWWDGSRRKAAERGHDPSRIYPLLGWPFDWLPRFRIPLAISIADGTALSVLAGWWLYTLMAHVPRQGQAAVLTAVVTVVLFGGCIQRTAMYCGTYRSPISIWGRIWTLRWIIPRYDVVFVTPLLTFLVVVIAEAMLIRYEVDLTIGTPIVVAIGTWIALNLGPTFEPWQLTGGHRIVPKYANKRDVVQL